MTDFAAILEQRIARRTLLKGGVGAVGLLALSRSFPGFANLNTSSSFTPLQNTISETHHVAEGHLVQLLLSWGDPILKGGVAFDGAKQSAARQAKQFGFNNDFIAYMPLEKGSRNSAHGLLCVNHEYTYAKHMFSGASTVSDKEQVDIQLAAHGHSVVEMKREKSAWNMVPGSRYNRRINALDTVFELTGPAAGSHHLVTSADPTGTRVIGTLNNCSGGVTPWGTVLIAEENFDFYFTGKATDAKIQKGHDRYRVAAKNRYPKLAKHYARFDVAGEPNEAHRFGWVVEYDPYNPKSQPKKRTALGRFKHEGAKTALCADGRVAVYSGDDEKFEYIYKFITKNAYSPTKPEANRNLLDEGTLYVARFDVEGLSWLPLVYGSAPLDESNGFFSQADVLINTRAAADLLGATPMDRPEDVAVNPKTGIVYAALSKNADRVETNVANPRRNNQHGHIIAMIPPQIEGKLAKGKFGTHDHAATEFAWEIAVFGGESDSFDSNMSCPDNLAFDVRGNVWVTTDGQMDARNACDGLYAMTGEHGHMQANLLFSVPRGAEATGPCFTPDGTTLFLSVQHPGEEDGYDYDSPSTRWPEFKDEVPPRPSIVAITRKDGKPVVA